MSSKVNIDSLSETDLLRVVASLIEEATKSMENKQGIRTGLFIRYAKEVMEMARIEPLACDDYDIKNGCVYISGSQVGKKKDYDYS